MMVESSYWPLALILFLITLPVEFWKNISFKSLMTRYFANSNIWWCTLWSWLMVALWTTDKKNGWVMISLLWLLIEICLNVVISAIAMYYNQLLYHSLGVLNGLKAFPHHLHQDELKSLISSTSLILSIPIIIISIVDMLDIFVVITIM